MADAVFGILDVNGWHNLVHIATGLLGLAAGGLRGARRTRSASASLYIVIAIWGFVETENGFGVLLDFIPVNTEDNILHLILGLTGLAAGAATPKEASALPRPRRPTLQRASARRPLARARERGCRPIAAQLGGDVADDPLRLSAQAARLAPPPGSDQHERAGRRTADGDRRDRPHPVARIAKRVELALGQLVGPAAESPPPPAG